MSGVRYLRGDRPVDERAHPYEGPENDEDDYKPDPITAPFRYSRLMGDFVRAIGKTPSERHNEELRWASLCGPVEIRYVTPRARRGGEPT